MDALAEFNQHRQALFGLAYRMLGSSMDAEDVLQEAFLHWQKAANEQIQQPKAYLVRIVTRLAIDHLRLAHVQREQYVGMWLPEPMMTSPEGDPGAETELAETLSTAFLLVLERLSPTDRAVFLLHDVFNYTYTEIAEIVGRNAADVRQIGHRARGYIAAERPRFPARYEDAEQATQAFIDAMQEGDLNPLFNVLAADVVLRGDGGGKINARRDPIYGVDDVVRFLKRVQRRESDTRILKLMYLNGTPAMVEYRDGEITSVTTFDYKDGRISAIFSLLNPDKLKGIAEQL